MRRMAVMLAHARAQLAAAMACTRTDDSQL
jgi:hypothetical protein